MERFAVILVLVEDSNAAYEQATQDADSVEMIEGLPYGLALEIIEELGRRGRELRQEA